MCTITNICELIQTYKTELKNHILQDIEVAEEVLAELGYEKTTKKKAPTPEESRPCPLGDSCLNNHYEVGSGKLCEGCGR